MTALNISCQLPAVSGGVATLGSYKLPTPSIFIKPGQVTNQKVWSKIKTLGHACKYRSLGRACLNHIEDSLLIGRVDALKYQWKCLLEPHPTVGVYCVLFYFILCFFLCVCFYWSQYFLSCVFFYINFVPYLLYVFLLVGKLIRYPPNRLLFPSQEILDIYCIYF